jgi:hypothetical protein
MWRKAWLETRWKLALMTLLDAAILTLFLDDGVTAAAWASRLDGPLPLIFLVNAVVLGGAGINTQNAFRPGQALHGSMLYTLSLPVTRRRLVLVRAAVGMLCAAALIATVLLSLWLIAPGVCELTASAGTLRVVAYVAQIIAAAAVASSVSALFATRLDDIWHTYAALAVVVGTVFGVPASRFWTGTLSPGATAPPAPFTGAAILLAAAFTAGILALAVRVVRHREF